MEDAAPQSARHPQRTLPTRLLVVLLVMVILGTWANHKLREVRMASRSASCVNDLKQLSIYMVPYLKAHAGLYPPISTSRGNIMMDPTGFYPEFMKSSAWVQCEYSDARRQPDKPDETDLGPDAFNDDSFFYLPWELRNEAEGLAYIDACKNLDSKLPEQGLAVIIQGNSMTLPRARLDSTPPVPILIEWSTPNHARRSVLYSDGSVRSMNPGEGFPMTEAFLKGMEELADLDGSISRRRNVAPGCFLPPKKG